MGQTQSDIAILDKTLRVAKVVTDRLEELTGVGHEVHQVEPNSFEVRRGNEDYAGGSYYIDQGVLILASITPQKKLGRVDDYDQIRTNLEF